MTTTKAIAPPEHLSNSTKELWRELVPNRRSSPGALRLLQTALESLDRAEAARLEIAAVGMTSTTKSTGAIHVHPLVKVERESRALFAAIWRDLSFGFDPKIDGMVHR